MDIDGTETFDLVGLSGEIEPLREMELVIHRSGVAPQRVPVRLRIGTPRELEYFRHGGILPYVLRDMLAAGAGHPG